MSIHTTFPNDSSDAVIASLRAEHEKRERQLAELRASVDATIAGWEARAIPSGRAGRASPEPASGLGHSATITIAGERA